MTRLPHQVSTPSGPSRARRRPEGRRRSRRRAERPRGLAPARQTAVRRPPPCRRRRRSEDPRREGPARIARESRRPEGPKLFRAPGSLRVPRVAAKRSEDLLKAGPARLRCPKATRLRGSLRAHPRRDGLGTRRGRLLLWGSLPPRRWSRASRLPTLLRRGAPARRSSEEGRRPFRLPKSSDTPRSTEGERSTNSPA